MSLNIPKKAKLEGLARQFKLGKPLGSGGNAVVYAAKFGTRPVAVKFLLNTDAKRYGRFRDEVLVVTTVLKGSTRVIPILEHHLPERAGAEIPWYAMPVATAIRKRLKDAPLKDRVRAIAELADGLVELHDKEVAHRDIKPENLFFFEDTFRFGDFGIAKFPDSSGLTSTTEPMGPLGYMADEMLRDSSSADPFRADVLSLAKTLWALLTDQPYPFLGQYSRRGRYSLDELLPRSGFAHEPIDDLLELATHSIPDKRPTPRAFAQELRRVLASQDDFDLCNPLQWAGAETLAFSVPCARMEWTDPKAIVEVVRLLSRRDSLNHCFFPTGGGLDITNAELTEGGDAILLWHGDGMATVLKANRLTLERLRAGPQESYATLESAALSPLGVSERDDWAEELMRCDEHNYIALPSEEDPWPKNLARVSRYFKPGMFIIAPKGGIYNRVDSYQGQGNALGRDKLRAAFEGRLKDKDHTEAAFRLRRTVRLLKRAQPTITSFLAELDLQTFQRLLEFDAAMKKLNYSSHEKDIESILTPDPNRVAKHKEIRQFLGELNAKQLGEAMALVQFGRRDIEDPADVRKHSASNAHSSPDLDYFVSKFGNGYFLKAIKRFGFEVVGTPPGE